jgi:hypothetical protein
MNRNATNIFGWRARRRGDVIIEYVLITFFLVTMLVGVNTQFFNPVPGIENGKFNFGRLGNAYVKWYHRVVAGVMLPFP